MTEAAKGKLRRAMTVRLRRAPAAARHRWDVEIQRQLLAHSVYREARWIHCYLGLPGEVATEPIVRAALAGTKQVTVPAVDAEQRCLVQAQIEDYDRELEPGSYGILEPPAGSRRLIDTGQIDLFILPGMAFDLRGYRLGHGLGYYDRWLGGVRDQPGRGLFCALAYEFQLVERVPTARHDMKVDLIITEKRVVEIKSGLEKKGRIRD
jgi:5-formyltetrahydrofolate cyclo-ligase